MEHNATIVPGSEKVSGSSLVFTVRCCDDASTDHVVTVANAGRLKPQDLTVLTAQQLRARAQHHADMQGLLEHLKNGRQ